MSALTTISRRTSRLAGGQVVLLLIGIPALIATVAIAVALQPMRSSHTVAAPAFDAVQFRAEERQDLIPVFNAVDFRAGERQQLNPAWDPVQFRAEERQDISPGFDAVEFRAGEKSLR